MVQKKPARGRPKGSGLDDRARLQSIAEILRSNPKMKPTTAIRSLGVTDPSTIRRLRDKYHSMQHDLAEQRLPPGAAPPRHRSAAPARSSELVSGGAVKHQSKQTEKTPQPACQKSVMPPKPKATPSPQLIDPAICWFDAWCGFGMQSVSTAMKIQFTTYQHFITMPPIALAWKNQMALNEIAIAMYRAGKPERPTVH